MSKEPPPLQFINTALPAAAPIGDDDVKWRQAEAFVAANADRLLEQLTANHAFFTRGTLKNLLKQGHPDWQPKAAVKRLAQDKAFRKAVATTLLEDFSRVIEFEPDAFPAPSIASQQPANENKAGKKAKTKKLKTRFTSVELYQQERQIIRTGQRWARESGAGVKPKQVDAAIAEYSAGRAALGKDPKVDEDVRAASYKSLEKKRFGILLGPPGAGKTTLIKIIGNALVKDGQTVLVTAVSGMLSQKLGNETGHNALPFSQVIASLSSTRNLDDVPELGLKRGGMLVIDEAAMLGSRDMHTVMQLASRHGLSIRAIGDTRQMAAASAGAPIEKLTEFIEPATLNRVVRQRNLVDQQATLDMHAGNAQKALRAYSGKRKRLAFLDNSDAVAAKAAADYAKWRSDGRNESQASAVLTLDEATTHKINALARMHLKEAEYLDDGIELATRYGTNEFSVHDRVIFRERIDLLEGSSMPRIYKGSVGTIEAITPGMMSVRLDGHDTPLQVPIQKQMRIMHAHAMEMTQPDPAESPQGSTLSRAFLAVTRPWSAPEATVGISRHKHKLTVYVDREVYPDLESLAADAAKRPTRLTTLDVEDRRRQTSIPPGPGQVR
ncbi:MAG: AAA family ATPase [Pseudomonadota bacterium]